MRPKTSIEIGDKVAFSRQFLQSINMHTGWPPFARGTVIDINEVDRDYKLALIEWTDKPEPTWINVANLVRTDQIHLENP
jgi:hypothetical protein